MFKTLLDEVIVSNIEKINELDVGSDERKQLIKETMELIKVRNETEKLEHECDESIRKREIDYDLKNKQTRDERIDRWVKNGIAIASIVIPVTVTIWGTIVSINFEKEGTLTTSAGRRHVNNALK
jgi:hypothetical protein